MVKYAQVGAVGKDALQIWEQGVGHWGSRTVKVQTVSILRNMAEGPEEEGVVVKWNKKMYKVSCSVKWTQHAGESWWELCHCCDGVALPVMKALVHPDFLPVQGEKYG